MTQQAPPDAQQPPRITEAKVRETLSKARRVVVKIGSRSLAAEPNMPAILAAQVRNLIDQGRTVALVSSGAVALGCTRLGFSERPKEVPLLQAAASAGQSELMRRYDQAFMAEGIVTAQVLITHSDLSNRKRLNNARSAFKALLDAGAVPIVNENDAVATDELRFSDNDHLAAMVAPVLDADALILLTDVAGVLDAQGQRISMMDDQGDFVDKGSDSSWGKGGMASKLEAALKARRAGISVVIASAFMPECIVKTMAGEDVGTCFAPAANILRARHHWIAYTLRPRGSLLIDAGAVEALRHGKRSLLPVGVLGLRGEFRRGDAVRIVSASGDEIGRGLCRLSALEVARAAGQKGTDLEMSLGGEKEVVVVHRDDLVVWD